MKTGKERLFTFYLLSCVTVIYYVVYSARTLSSSTQHPTINNVTNNVYHQTLNECLCSRKFMYPPSRNENKSEQFPARLNSSCSDVGTYYQTGQNVISFSLFVKTGEIVGKEYREGVVQNLEMMRKYYPGYSLRLYTNLPLKKGFPYCTLICKNTDLFWCHMKYTPSHGDLSEMVFRTWRFLALGDPTVEVFLSRDLDSLISDREAAVVHDWLSKGDKAISLMRDRAGGHNKPILAGMWEANNRMLGMAKASALREEIINLSKMKKYRYKWSDQSILNRVVFYPRAKDIVAYDPYNCVKWRQFTEVRPFPTQSDDPTRDFVGNRVDFANGRGKHNYSADVCPQECRPEHGKDWTYC